MTPLNESGRTALVTGGATVVFQELLDEVVDPGFLLTLNKFGFTSLLIQCGSDHERVKHRLAQMGDVAMAIETFAFSSDLKTQMKRCRGEMGVRPAGVVISHAGTGTIADCWEVQVANIIVANPNLMDNHQEQFAEEMARQSPTVIHGHLGKLDEAVPKVIEAINKEGLEKLGPYEELTFPLREEDRLYLIDQVIAQN